MTCERNQSPGGQASPVPSGGTWKTVLRPFIGVIIGIGFVALLAVGWSARSSSVGQLPELNLDRVDPQQAELILQRRDRVLASPNSVRRWGEMGMLLSANGLHEPADACYARAAALAPHDYRWSYLLGVSLEPRDPGAAAEHYQIALEKQDKPILHLRLAELLLKQRQLEKAKRHIDLALDRDPQNPRGWFDRARVLFLQDQYRESLEWTQRAIAAAPDQKTPRLLLLRLYHQLGELELEQQPTATLREQVVMRTAWPDPLVERVMALRQNAQAAHQRAAQLVSTGRFEEAIQALEIAVTQEPHVPDHAVQLAGLYLRIGDLDRAEAVLQDAMERHPNVIELQMLRARIGYQRGNWNLAADGFQRVIDQQPDFALAHFNLGQCQEKLGNREIALASFRRAVAIEPDFVEAKARLGELSVDTPSQ